MSRSPPPPVGVPTSSAGSKPPARAAPRPAQRHVRPGPEPTGADQRTRPHHPSGRDVGEVPLPAHAATEATEPLEQVLRRGVQRGRHHQAGRARRDRAPRRTPRRSPSSNRGRSATSSSVKASTSASRDRPARGCGRGRDPGRGSTTYPTVGNSSVTSRRVASSDGALSTTRIGVGRRWPMSAVRQRRRSAGRSRVHTATTIDGTVSATVDGTARHTEATLSRSASVPASAAARRTRTRSSARSAEIAAAMSGRPPGRRAPGFARFRPAPDRRG